MSEFTNAAISPAGGGRLAIAFGHNLIRISAKDTGGAIAVMETTLGAGEGTPMHVHGREDESFRVLSGRFGFWCADDYVELEEGGLISLPRGVPHRFQNVGDGEGSVMVILTPGGFEDFFVTIENRKPKDADEIASIAAEFGLTFLPPREGE
jgi:mannose-6-phosphate isomerase-like protein (cupin superfamily)